MNEKQSLFDEVSTRKTKKPSAIYNVLAFIGKHFVYKNQNITIKYNVNVKELKPPFIVVANHQSRADFAYVGIPMLPHRLTFITAFNEFFRSHTAPTLKANGVIPKRSYYSDVRMVREVGRALKNGGAVAIFTEGEACMAGANQPMQPGSGKFFKHFKVPVITVKLTGGFLTNPKYSTIVRQGRIEVQVDKFFTAEQLSELTPDEIQGRLEEHLYNDDFEWNKTARVKFNMHGQAAKNLHHLLYWCPKCHSEYKTLGEGDTIKCTECGNGAILNDYYDLIPLTANCVIPDTIRVWYDMQRELVKEEIKDPDFSYTESVKMGMLNHYKLLKHKKTSEPAGEGAITINHDGFSYKGTKYGEQFEYTIRPENILSLNYITDMHFFANYYEDEMYEFTPENARTMKFRLCVEEMHRLHGGKWVDKRGN